MKRTIYLLAMVGVLVFAIAYYLTAAAEEPIHSGLVEVITAPTGFEVAGMTGSCCPGVTLRHIGSGALAHYEVTSSPFARGDYTLERIAGPAGADALPWPPTLAVSLAKRTALAAAEVEPQPR